MRKSLDEIIKKINEQKEEEKKRAEEELNKINEINKKLIEHRRFLDHIYESLPTTAGAAASSAAASSAAAGAGGTSFRKRLVNNIPTFSLPSQLDNPITGYGAFITSEPIGLTISRFVIDFYISTQVLPEANDPQRNFLFANKSNNESIIIGNSTSGIDGEIISFFNRAYLIGEELPSVDIGMHRLDFTYNESDMKYNIKYDGVDYGYGLTGSTTSIINYDFSTFSIHRRTNSNYISNGSYVKEITSYDENGEINFYFLNENEPNGFSYSTTGGYSFTVENILEEASVGQLVTLSCTISATSSITEYQNVLNFWTSQGYTLPSENVQSAQKDLVTTIVTNNLWDKLDVLLLPSSNGDFLTKITNFIDLATYSSNSSSSEQFKGNYNKGINGIFLNYENLEVIDSINNFSYDDGVFGIFGRIIKKPISTYPSSSVGQFVNNLKLDISDGSLENYKIVAYMDYDEYSVIPIGNLNGDGFFTYSITRSEVESPNSFIVQRESSPGIGTFLFNGNIVATQSFTYSTTLPLTSFSINGGLANIEFMGNPIQPLTNTQDSNYIYSATFIGGTMSNSELSIMYNAINDYLNCINYPTDNFI
jgi:hypothetical protein